jgi:hypothetical protein
MTASGRFRTGGSIDSSGLQLFEKRSPARRSGVTVDAVVVFLQRPLSDRPRAPNRLGHGTRHRPPTGRPRGASRLRDQ